MVLRVVLLEDGRVRDAHDEVAKDTNEPVAHRVCIAECHVVRDLVYRECHRVVEDATEAVRNDDDREEGRLPQKIGRHKLHYYHADNDELEVRVVYHQLLHLWMLG